MMYDHSFAVDASYLVWSDSMQKAICSVIFSPRTVAVLKPLTQAQSDDCIFLMRVR